MAAAMSSAITCVQPGWATSTGKIRSDAPVASRTRCTAMTTSAAHCSASISQAHRCSEFLGSGVHGSSSSVIFNLERSIAERKAAVACSSRSRRGQGLVVRGLFGLGVPELAVIAGVAAILFGPKKLPEIGKSLGKTVKSFQQAAKEFETEVKTRAATADPTLPETEADEPQRPTSANAQTSTTSKSSDKDNA